MRLMMRRILEHDHYVVVEAAGGPEALAVFQQQPPEMVLLDAKMPGMDGFETCIRLRQLPGGQRLPVLMITSLDDPESVNRAFEAGATDYILKPINWKVLSRRVHHLTQASQAEEALIKERNLLRTLIDNLPDYIYVKDSESRFIAGNMVVAQVMGAASPNELIGKTDFDFYPSELAAQYYAGEQTVIRSG